MKVRMWLPNNIPQGCFFETPPFFEFLCGIVLVFEYLELYGPLVPWFEYQVFWVAWFGCPELRVPWFITSFPATLLWFCGSHCNSNAVPGGSLEVATGCRFWIRFSLIIQHKKKKYPYTFQKLKKYIFLWKTISSSFPVKNVNIFWHTFQNIISILNIKKLGVQKLPVFAPRIKRS